MRIMRYCFLLVLLCGWQVLQAQTESEPNDTITTANTLALGGGISGTTSQQADVDYFKIVMPHAGVLIGDLNAGTTGIAYVLTIVDPTAAANVCYSLAANPGDPVHIEGIVPAGTYCIRVERTAGALSSVNSYSLTTSADTSDDFEWNNTPATAPLVPRNTTVSGKIRGQYLDNASYDVDYYKVRPGHCGVLIADIPANATGVGYNVFIKDSITGGTLFSWISLAANDSVHVEALVPSTAVYVEVARGTGAFTSLLPYTLHLTLDTTDQGECNNSFAGAHTVQPCIPLSATMRPSGDRDYYAFFGSGANTVASVYNVPANLQLELIAYDHNMTQISGASAQSPGQSVNLNIPVTNTDVYYVRVSEVTNTPNPDTYAFTISCGTAVGTITDLKDAVIYPNPSDGNFRITLPTAVPLATVEITNALGQLVFTGSASNKGTNISLSAPAGIYFMKLKTVQQQYTTRLLIEK